MIEYDRVVAQRISSITTEQELTLLYAQCMAMLTANKARQQELMEQGHMTRFLRNVSGQKRQLSQHLTNDVLTAQQLAQEMLQQLATRQLLTLQMTSTLHQKVNTLQLENDAKFEQIISLIQQAHKKSSEKWQHVQRNVANLKTNVQLMRWTLMHDTTLYHQLAPAAFVLTIVHDFYVQAQGNWQEDDLVYLKKLLREYDIPSELASSAYFEQSVLCQQLFELVPPLPKQDELYLPPTIQLLREPQKKVHIQLVTEEVVFTLLTALVLIKELTRPVAIRYEVTLANVVQSSRIHMLRTLHELGFSSEQSRQLVRSEQAAIVRSYSNYEEAMALKRLLEEHACHVMICEMEHFI